MNDLGIGRLTVCLLGAALAVVPAATANASPGEFRAAEVSFPIKESFSSGKTNNPKWIAGGAAKLISDNGGWLQLNPAQKAQSGSFILDDSFSSSKGIVAEFDYNISGAGSAKPKGKQTGGDGFSVFFIDGSKKPTTGPFGAALGYACLSKGQKCEKPGVAGGYVGVGFDVYGNYSTPAVGNGKSPGKATNRIVVRGSGDGVQGYQYLLGADAPGGLPLPDAASARKVRIGILGSTVSVRVQAADGTWQTVIGDTDISRMPGQAPLPKSFKIGFAASTGSVWEQHRIKNLKVALPTDLNLTVDGPDKVKAGEEITYALTATSVGFNGTETATIAYNVPAAIKDVTWTCVAGSGASCGKSSGSGNTIKVPVGLPKRGKVTVYVKGKVDAAARGSMVNSAQAVPSDAYLDDNPASSSATFTTKVEPAAPKPAPAPAPAPAPGPAPKPAPKPVPAPKPNPAPNPAPAVGADLQTSVSVSGGKIAAGESFAYNIVTTNHGPSAAANVGTRFVLSPGLQLVKSEPTGCRVSGRQVACPPVATLANGKSVTYRAIVRLDPSYTGDGSDLAVVASAASDTKDPNQGDNSSKPAGIPGGTPKSPVSDLQIAVKPVAGKAIQVVLDNRGPSSTRAPATVKVKLPKGTTAARLGRACRATADKLVVECQEAAGLQPGGRAAFDVGVKVDPAVAVGAELTGGKVELSAPGDLDAADNVKGIVGFVGIPAPKPGPAPVPVPVPGPVPGPKPGPVPVPGPGGVMCGTGFFSAIVCPPIALAQGVTNGAIGLGNAASFGIADPALDFAHYAVDTSAALGRAAAADSDRMIGVPSPVPSLPVKVGCGAGTISALLCPPLEMARTLSHAGVGIANGASFGFGQPAFDFAHQAIDGGVNVGQAAGTLSDRFLGFGLPR